MQQLTNKSNGSDSALDMLLVVLLCAALGWANTSAVGWAYRTHIEPNLPAPIVKRVATEAVAASTVQRKSTKRGRK